MHKINEALENQDEEKEEGKVETRRNNVGHFRIPAPRLNANDMQIESFSICTRQTRSYKSRPSKVWV